MRKILLCDDDREDLKRLERMVQKWCDDNALQAEISAFLDARDVTVHLKQHGAADIYILDVLMPYMSGIELGRLIRQMDTNGRILYLTSTRDFAVDSYEVDAFYYLIKPVTADRLAPLLAKAAAKKRNASDASLCVHTKDGDVMLLLSDIDYVESSMRFPHYVTGQGHFTGIMLRSAFRDEMRELLSYPEFYLCGASFVLNLSRIKAVEKSGVLFAGGKSVSLPRSSIPGLRTAWTDYWLV